MHVVHELCVLIPLFSVVLAALHVWKEVKEDVVLCTSFFPFSLPRCACHDLCRIWLSDDIPSSLPGLAVWDITCSWQRSPYNGQPSPLGLFSFIGQAQDNAERYRIIISLERYNVLY